MKPKSLIILLVLTVLVVIAAVYAVRARAPAKASPEGGRLFPVLDERAEDIASIEVLRGGETLTLERGEDGWHVPVLSGYPAEFDRVRDVVLKLSEMKIVEKKTRKPERYARLGVEDPRGEDAKSALVTLRDASGEEIVAAILGEVNYGRGGQTVYVRPAGEEQAYLCDGDLSPQADPMSWISRDVLKIQSTRVQSAKLTHADGEVLAISKSLPVEPDYTVSGVPVGRKLKTESVANSIGSALAYLSLEDVKPVHEIDFEAEPVSVAEFRTFDGLVLTLDTAKVGEDLWAKVDVRFEEPPAPVGPEPEPGSEEGAVEEPPPSEAQAAKNDEVRTEAREFATRLTGWAFKIPSYKADLLARRMTDLLMELPSEETEDEAEGPPAGGGEAGAEGAPAEGAGPEEPMGEIRSEEGDEPTAENPAEDPPGHDDPDGDGADREG